MDRFNPCQNFDDAYFASDVSPSGLSEPNEAASLSTHSKLSHISISWLNGRGNWRVDAEERLRVFMRKNDFYHYKSNDPRCKLFLEQITLELSSLFDPTKWCEGEHEELLQKKIKHKMHSIRRAAADTSHFKEVKKVLQEGDEHEKLKLFQLIIQTVGKKEACRLVNAC